MSTAAFERALAKRRDVILRMATHRVPPASEAQNLADRFRSHGAAYFTFVSTSGLPPTNNLAEQAIRFVVLDRRITQGTRGESAGPGPRPPSSMVNLCYHADSELHGLRSLTVAALIGEHEIALLGRSLALPFERRRAIQALTLALCGKERE